MYPPLIINHTLLLNGEGCVVSLTHKVHYLDTQGGEQVFHQVLIDPGISFQPLAADPDDLWPLKHTHLQLKRHGHLAKITPGPTLQGISKGRVKKMIQKH